MGNAVARPGEMHTEFHCSRCQKNMIVGVLVIGLQQVVVNVLSGQIHFDPGQSHGDKLQHRHRTGSVLQQSVVDSD